jgi:hypothetical protein
MVALGMQRSSWLWRTSTSRQRDVSANERHDWRAGTLAFCLQIHRISNQRSQHDPLAGCQAARWSGKVAAFTTVLALHAPAASGLDDYGRATSFAERRW